MDAEEDPVALQARLEQVTAEKATLERVLAVTLGVISDSQWGEIRSKLDAEDARAAQAAR